MNFRTALLDYFGHLDKDKLREYSKRLQHKEFTGLSNIEKRALRQVQLNIRAGDYD